MAMIERDPQRFGPPPTYRGTAEVRRYLLKSFRYMIVYQVLGESLLAVYVVHSTRHPKDWRKRIRP